MHKATNSELKFQLHKATVQYSDILFEHQWPYEYARWVELLFALLTRVYPIDEELVRYAVESLSDLGLLEINQLAEIPIVDGKPDKDNLVASRIITYLSELGFANDDVYDGLMVMIDAAKNLRQHHDGKIQKYLRHYGVKMIAELPQHFTFSKMKQSDIQYAFSYWLQNVMNMPILMKDEYISEFAQKHGGSFAGLVDVADDLDINLAVVDDLIFYAETTDEIIQLMDDDRVAVERRE